MVTPRHRPGVGDLSEPAAQARNAMVDALARAGAAGGDPAVLAAMGRVPREAFVPRFWTLPPPLQAGTPADIREWRLDDPATNVAALDLVYDIDRALAIRRDPDAAGPTAGAGVTSTASAPRIVASMLDLLDLQAGMRVLEIGAGSGYNAALIRELVGPEGSVASIDIDAELVAGTRERLHATGYGDVRVVAGDGYFGLPELAPFDRVVATVGCADASPSWLEQLGPGGFCLLPIQHGGWHPLMRFEPSAGGATAVVVGRSGFVGIQGRQAGTSPWPRAGPLGPAPDVEWEPLPPQLAAVLNAEEGREVIGGRRLWDLAYLLALEDGRTAFLASLAEDGSSAAIEAEKARVGWRGPAGPHLRDRLLEVAERWCGLGRPSVADYTSVFTPRPEGSTAPAHELVAGSADGEWVVDRLDFRQTVRLTGPR